ncbi:MAG: cation:proton antiporter [Gemmatimonadales bacterium]|nr:cation:proton antiporter [Gemmatimonadales bacterium]MDQ3426577.1 cation:proton antiporter [Gemmatimonadota bacterium]
MIRRLVVLALLVGGALLLEPLRAPTAGVIAPRSLFLFGMLLLTADTFGAVAHEFRVPRLVGYLVAGLALGPSATGIVPAGVLEDLGMMKRLAVGLIGLLAGAELRVSDLRQRHRSILFILALQTLAVMTALTALGLLGRSWVPFLTGLEAAPLVFVVLLFAATLTVNSPMVTLALLTETKAAGPLAKTTLGVVLVADVVVILIFTATFSLAEASLGGETAGAPQILRHLLSGVLGSILAGAVVGGVLTLYLRFVKRELVVFAIVLVFATAAAAQALGFELLLSLLVAGFLVENVAPVRAEPLVETLHQMAVPVFVIFFALAGAELHVREFRALWPLVLAVALVRMGAIFVGSRAGGRLAGAEPVVTRFAWTGLVPQAGVALGLATVVADRLPRLGLAMQTLIVGVIAFNESVGPLLFRRGLERAGEIAAR